MARCPTCDAELDHVIAQTIDLEETDAIPGSEGSGQAVVTVCPQCDAIIGI